MDGFDRRDWIFVQTAIYVLLRKYRKTLNPADLTELRVALQHARAPENLRNKLERLLDEKWVEREEKKETPRKHD